MKLRLFNKLIIKEDKMNFNKIVSVILTIIASVFFIALLNKSYGQVNPWKVTGRYLKMDNPVKYNDSSIKKGSVLWEKSCASCHGKDGEGEGKIAATLNSQLPDFAKSDFQKQTDGEIFFKLTFGRDDMPGFEKKIPSKDDRWSLVNFIRSLKK
jgi:cytochrome c